MNPLLQDWSTPFGMPPFDAISEQDFAPAFAAAFAESRAAYAAIANDPGTPTFENTIAAMERADKALNRVGGVFFNLAEADSSDALEAIQRDVAPKFAAHSAEILMNAALFRRVEAVAASGEKLGPEQSRVLQLYHRMFVRAGARLGQQEKARLQAIMERLATLGTAFAQNVLADEKSWSLDLAPADLDGLPADLIDALAETARERGKQGHVLTLGRAAIVPFLQFSPRRDLREIAFKAWTARGANAGATNNEALINETLRLRDERAKLLGYASFADYKLETEMAHTPQAVREMLMTVWGPAQAQALADQRKLEERLHADGFNGTLQPWDWRYYSEARRKAEHDLDDAEIKPYFQLEQMIAACFHCAERLFGLSFHPLDLPLYHPDARAWDVREGDRHVGVFIGDYFARSSKRSGAWSSTFRAQNNLDGSIRPIVVNVCNSSKAPAGQASLLTFDDAATLFHEFGHALHALLSNVTYPLIAGTNTATDFVELPSQLYEHWLAEPQVLEQFALHATTGQPMPADLLTRLLAARNYDMGFQTVEYLSSALVDLDFHDGQPPQDALASQAETLTRIGMPAAITMRHATPHFQHVFTGDGYSSGYYSYMWSEMMDADAFESFRETGDIFDAETAGRLKEHILSAGGSRDEAELYKAFRGKLPGVGALLRQRGFPEREDLAG